jgi:SAM-dependent methyltransferase
MWGPGEGSSAGQTRAQDAYALGRNPAEADRLGRQSLELWRLAEAVLDRVRLRPGQRAIDLGCGPRGILDLLSERVGPGGQVVGLDRDPVLVDRARALVTACGLANVDVVAGDARRTQLPSSTFDLVHTRTLLVNIPDPAEVVTEMTRLARPGGWVVAVEPDLTGLLCHPPLPAWDRLAEIAVAAFRVDGAQLQMGRHVPGLFRQAGLTEVEAEVRAELYPAGHSRRTIRLDLVRSMRAKIVTHEIASEQELDDLDRTIRAHLDDPDTLMIPNLYFLVWGRKFKTHLSERTVAPPHRDESAAGGDQAGLVGEDDGLDAVA